MFKFRIKRWGFDKNKKKDDSKSRISTQVLRDWTRQLHFIRIFTKYNSYLVLFVIHKTKERENLGKKTSFTVRGRVITKEEVLHYFERRKEKPHEKATPSTPPYISYRTPSPQPQAMTKYERFKSPGSSSQTLSSRTLGNYRAESPVFANNQLFGTQPLPDGTFLSYMKTEDVQREFSASPELPYFIAPPQIYVISEDALASIKTYIDSAVQSGMWITNSEGFCINSRNSDASIDAFNGHMFAVDTLLRPPSTAYVEARRTLSQAFDKIPQAILSEKPMSFHCILYHVSDNYASGRQKIATMLLSHISAIASVVLPAGSLWRHIWELLGSLEEHQLKDALLMFWKCSIDAAATNLGAYHSLPISSYINYLNICLGDDFLQEEIALRELLAGCEKDCGKVSAASCRLMYKLSGNLLRQQKWAECETLCIDLVERARAVEGQWERLIGGLENLAESQYNLKKNDLAEMNIREGNRELLERMRSSGQEFGLFIVANLTLLETWLREWGRVEEAENVKAEMGSWIGHDDIDKELGIEEP